MVSEEMTSEARDLIFELLADGAWHSHRQLLGDLIRTPVSEYAIKGILEAMGDDPRIETEDRRVSHLHSPSCWYRLRTST